MKDSIGTPEFIMSLKGAFCMDRTFNSENHSCNMVDLIKIHVEILKVAVPGSLNYSLVLVEAEKLNWLCNPKFHKV